MTSKITALKNIFTAAVGRTVEISGPGIGQHTIPLKVISVEGSAKPTDFEVTFSFDYGRKTCTFIPNEGMRSNSGSIMWKKITSVSVIF